jgi:Xaa-Pro dipeptidase
MSASSKPSERVERVARLLSTIGLEALVCTVPRNVLMLSGYWPVVGRSLAVVTASGASAVVLPEDERELARLGWADELVTFEPGSLERVAAAPAATAEALRVAAARLGLVRARVGYESSAWFSPAPYAAVHGFGAALPELLSSALATSGLVAADETIAALGSAFTRQELDRLRLACAAVETAYRAGARALRPGLSEVGAAARFRAGLSDPVAREQALRADGFVYCMSGPRSAEAFAAFQRSGARRLAAEDLVLVYCNSYVDGYFTDVTRTYSLGVPAQRVRRMYEAVLSARDAALARIAPGVRASEVDRAARDVIETFGFGAGFRHGTGHAVGFAAVDHDAPPRLHPKSEDVLEPGMVFNVEPAVYEHDVGGIRHSDMVVVTERGAQVLTPFHDTLAELVISPGPPPAVEWGQ